jgi:hypothetical protein
MKIRHSIVIAGAVLAFSPAAFASEDAGKSCTALQQQFDKEIAVAKSDRAGEAQSLREQGAKLCAEGKSAEGTAKIKEALTLIGGTAPPKTS